MFAVDRARGSQDDQTTSLSSRAAFYQDRSGRTTGVVLDFTPEEIRDVEIRVTAQWIMKRKAEGDSQVADYDWSDVDPERIGRFLYHALGPELCDVAHCLAMEPVPKSPEDGTSEFEPSSTHASMAMAMAMAMVGSSTGSLTWKWSPKADVNGTTCSTEGC